jgi:hypothetical protein
VELVIRAQPRLLLEQTLDMQVAAAQVLQQLVAPTLMLSQVDQVYQAVVVEVALLAVLEMLQVLQVVKV